VSRIGQYFANKMSGQKSDPVQYACQRNYAIVATDGAWNAGPGTQLDGSTPVGQQDGGEVRPMFDGENTLDRMRRLLHEREPFYLQADAELANDPPRTAEQAATRS